MKKSFLKILALLCILAQGMMLTACKNKQDVPRQPKSIVILYETHKQIATCPFELTINGADGKRLVRNGETNMADIITDAFREKAQAQIGLCNGGGIRASIPAGIITYGDVINVQPFNNQMVRVEATGSTIIAILDSCTASLPDECGSFPQVACVTPCINDRTPLPMSMSMMTPPAHGCLSTRKAHTPSAQRTTVRKTV